MNLVNCSAEYWEGEYNTSKSKVMNFNVEKIGTSAPLGWGRPTIFLCSDSATPKNILE